MGRVICLASGKGGVGKSLGYYDSVSLANGSLVQIGPYVDSLIEKQANVGKIKILSDGSQEVFEVLKPTQDLVLDTFSQTQDGFLQNSKQLPIALMRKPAPKELFRVSTSSGSIETTPEHKFIVFRNGILQKVRTDEINAGTDYLALFSQEFEPAIIDGSISEGLAEFFGYLIGDGHMRENSLQVFCEENDSLQRIRNAFQEVFGHYSECIDKRSNVHKIYVGTKSEINEVLEKSGAKIALSGEKTIPSRFFLSSNKTMAVFLRALFDCDGTVALNRRQVEFCSKSKNLVLEVSSALRTRFGIISQVRSAFKIACNSKMREKAEYWNLAISGENAIKFEQKIGFLNQFKKERLQRQNSEKKPLNTNIDVFPVGQTLKKIRACCKLSASQLAKLLGCTKQLVYEYERGYYALSRQTLQKFIDCFEKLSVKTADLEFLKTLSQSNYSFRKVNSVEIIPYDKEFVYDFQVSENGGHFCHSSGIIVSNTFLTGNLGIALAQSGYSVCLVDADIAMANLSLLLGMQSSPITLHDVLLGESTVQDAIYDGPKGVKFLPSGLSLENYRRVDAERLETVIESIANQFDFVLIDVPAGIEKNVLAAIAASDEVLLVTTPDSPSVADVLKTKIVAQRLNRKTIGVILNFIRGEKGEITDNEVMKLLELPVYGLIPYDPEVRKTFLHEKGGPLMARNPQSPAALAVQKTASKITGKEVSIASIKKPNAIARFFNSLFSIFKGKPKQNAKPEE